MVYRKNTSSIKDLENYFENLDNNFITSLKNRVSSIPEYLEKLEKNATLFEVWEQDKLIGLLACYCNNLKEGIGYITHVSVLPDFRKKGIAKKLIKLTIAHLKKMKFKYLKLEVRKDNQKAISLYAKHNFQLEKILIHTQIMARSIY